MTAHAYNLDTDKARDGDSTGSNRINTSGAYTGIITVAKAVTANTGASGIEFSFKSDDGQEAHYMTLYTRNAQGESIFGEKRLNTIMTCLKVRSINPVQAQIKEYDFDAQQEIEVTRDVYPDLMNKPIGLVLQMEEYFNNSGNKKSRMNIYGAFDAQTRQTAIEILDQLPAERLDKMVENVRDKLVQKTTQSAPMPTSGSVDDDIPFFNPYKGKEYLV